MMRKYMSYGALHALLAVVLGAFAAHGLKSRLTTHMLDVFETGVRYQMYHALGLILVAIMSEKLGQKGGALRTGGKLLHIGIFLFSGSLYVLSLSGIGWLGAITPLGGLCFIAGWALTAWAAWKARN
ncbi:DUF423 domain-containing protein [Paenibacillus beijingensis]|uniref:Membrane protein n=1 Tax=Paenibacillus beijingensis TaxID=1126833 RepID=A0A0D5NKS3_9BACL|nr:DUF423 domain-containing protein [Paenibacillus beijingensis]AJY75949.1 membrane protein [Paenibacillus beijingensis]